MAESLTMPSASSGSVRMDTRPTSTPPPTTRWGIAADLNGFATTARQRHQPLASPRTGITHVPSHDAAEIRARESHAFDGPTATTRHDNVHEMAPLTDVVRNLQQAMSAMTQQMGEIIRSQSVLQGSSAAADSSGASPRTIHDPNTAPTTQSFPRPNVFSLTTAMETIERSTGVSLRSAPAFADTFRWQRCATNGVASESLPDVETVSPALRAAILDGRDTNLASLLIPHFDLGDYSRYAGVDGSHHLLRPLSSDPRLNRNLTLAEFIAAFNKYGNII